MQRATAINAILDWLVRKESSLGVGFQYHVDPF